MRKGRKEGRKEEKKDDPRARGGREGKIFTHMQEKKKRHKKSVVEK